MRVKEREKSTNALLVLCKFGLGILVLVLFRWTPQTGKGILIYLALLAVMIAGAIGASSMKGDTGYWPEKPPEKPEDR